MDSEELSTLIEVNAMLSRISIPNQSPEYSDIVDRTFRVIHNNCSHDMCHDCIDVDCDRSQTILYCVKCLLTFDIEQIYRYLFFSLKGVDKDLWTIYYDNQYCKLNSFFTQNNKIGFSIILKGNHMIFFVPFYDLYSCKVVSNVVYTT
uniref:Uncharacterized protein n=1 Tax=viral metagenome TaxID=1070528 RepID=A0A6C0IN52_9ZZZZ